MNRHQIIGIVTGVCGVILAITARSQAIITLIIFTLVALSIFFKDKHPLLSRRLLPPWALYCLCVFTLVSAIFVSFHTHVKHAPRPFLGKNTQGVDPKTQDPQNTLPDAQNDISLTRTPVRKKILEIMASEDFTKQIKESVDNDTEPKHLSSFSNFLKYLESQGVSGLKNSGPLSYYQNIFQNTFLGKCLPN